MTKLTLKYETDNMNITIEQEVYGDRFDDIYQALRYACMALGFEPETVKFYFDSEALYVAQTTNEEQGAETPEE